MANKNQLKNSPLKTIEEENKKNIKLRQNEIDSIKHESKKVWIKIYSNPLTYIFIVAFIIACFYYDSFKEATGSSAIWLLEYFMLQHYESTRNKK
jgi:L-asparagine transporter-like permease